MAKSTSRTTTVFSAINTPLRDDDSLHVEGLEAHIEDQWRSGIHGILVGGTMGLMQLLTDRTYQQLVEHSVRAGAGRGEIFIGVGDTSLARTRERIEYVNRFKVDGVVVLSPYLFKFTPDELVSYFCGLADASRSPLYLYDLPVRTGVKLDFDTVEKVAKHPNIFGIKASCDPEWTKELLRRMGDRFRVIIAQPTLVPSLIREGVHEHLDGIFSVMPAWTMTMFHAADAGDCAKADEYQARIKRLLDLVVPSGVFPGVTAILNACGIPGKCSPAPMSQPDAALREQLLADPLVAALVRGDT
jgi:4-hydroxy-tetrahydrodipicolinate synthase